MRILNNARIDSYSSFRLPATARRLIQINSREGVVQALSQFAGQPFYLLGAGSNSVFLQDMDISLLQFHGRGFAARDLGDGRVRVQVGAGENWHRVVVRCCHAAWHGLENLALIPGDCGAAPVQNIGAYGVELAEHLEWVDAVDLQRRCFVRLTNVDCQFAYRDSLFKRHLGRYLITDLAFILQRRFQPRLDYADLARRFDAISTTLSAKQLLQAVIDIRRSKLPDPGETPNCGSFFKNPVVPVRMLQALRNDHALVPNWPLDTNQVKLSAAWLIDQCGLRGYRVGGAAVSEQHALVLVNLGQATGTQLAELIDHVRDQVNDRFGIWLEPEVRLLGSAGVLDPALPVRRQLN